MVYVYEKGTVPGTGVSVSSHFNQEISCFPFPPLPPSSCLTRKAIAVTAALPHPPLFSGAPDVLPTGTVVLFVRILLFCPVQLSGVYPRIIGRPICRLEAATQEIV